jgi:hypothetical protein
MCARMFSLWAAAPYDLRERLLLTCVSQREIFVCERLTVDGLATSAILAREIAALHTYTAIGARYRSSHGVAVKLQTSDQSPGT